MSEGTLTAAGVVVARGLGTLGNRVGALGNRVGGSSWAWHFGL